MDFKKHKGVLARFSFFLILVYVALPFIFWLVEKSYRQQFRFNFFYFMIFSLMIVGMFLAYNRKKIARYKFKSNWQETGLFLGLAALSYGGYFMIKYKITAINLYLSIVLSYGLYFLGFVLIALGIFGSSFFKNFSKSITACLLVVYTFFMATVAILWQLGRPFSIVTSKIVHALVSQTGMMTGLAVGGGDPSLKVGEFSAVIGAPCSGIESLAMFLGVGLLAAAYDWKKIYWKKGLLVFSLGMMGIFLVNIIRVSVLMLVGTKSPDLANNLFHNNLGWIFFVIYVMLIIVFVYPKIIKR